MTGLTLANICILLAGLLPIVTVGIAKAGGGSYDNHDPRARAAGYDGLARRAYAAHQNGFEAFPLFAAAVIVAEMKGGAQGAINALAIAFIVLRVGYVAAYAGDRPTLRSILWALAFLATLAIFLTPAMR
jgi:uncharacterized MAPEG superfamily protein